MEYQIHKVGKLAFIDERLDELKDEFGDLPAKVKEQEIKVNKLNAMSEETRVLLNEAKSFISTAKITLVELKDKEETLSKQQFMVRNNKEFDSINTEIKFLKEEHEKLLNKMREASLKEENLKTILNSQEKAFIEEKAELDVLEVEIKEMSAAQNSELGDLYTLREKVVKDVEPKLLVTYDRIRSFHSDAAVYIKRNSCTGCFSSIPPQIIVHVRNNIEKIHFCENCARILIPEEVEIDTNF